MNLMLFNGLLLFMLFMWTSAELEPEPEPVRELQHQDYDQKSHVEIQARRKACRDLDGKCIKKNRDCPKNRPLKKSPGRPFCNKRRHCCYPEPSTTSEPLAPVPNLTLPALTEKLLAYDINNVFGKLDITGDKNKLISTKDPNIFAGETYVTLRDLQINGNYFPNVNEKENISSRETKQNAFINAIMKTEVMKITEKFLLDKDIITGTDNLSDVLKKIWFTLYSRAKDNVTLGSSGFEHVFRGEINKNKKLSGFHNWVFFFHEQENPTPPALVYKPPLKKILNLGTKGKLVQGNFNWLNKPKLGGSMFIGTSPELDMAVYTLCFLVMPGENCSVRMALKDFNIVTHKFNGLELVGSAYPVVPS